MKNIEVTYNNALTLTYSISILKLLLSDPAVIQIKDKTTGKTLFARLGGKFNDVQVYGSLQGMRLCRG